MERIPHSTSAHSHSASGGLIRLQARLGDPITWLGPTWAVLCGVVASDSFDWQPQDWLRLAVLTLMVDGGWGTLWAVLGSTKWAAPLRRWRNWRFGEPAPTPPYTLSGSYGDRASHWLGQLWTWWRDILWPTCGPAISAALVALPVTVVLGILLGPDVLLLSITALALMQLGIAWQGGQGAVAPKWDAVITVALPWLAGHTAFGSLTLPSSVLALTFALAWGAAWSVHTPWERTLEIGGQLLATAILVSLHHSLEAAVLLLLLVPQMLLLPWIQRGQPASWYVRHTRPWLMAAMLIAAWALS